MTLHFPDACWNGWRSGASAPCATNPSCDYKTHHVARRGHKTRKKCDPPKMLTSSETLAQDHVYHLKYVLPTSEHKRSYATIAGLNAASSPAFYPTSSTWPAEKRDFMLQDSAIRSETISTRERRMCEAEGREGSKHLRRSSHEAQLGNRDVKWR